MAGAVAEAGRKMIDFMCSDQGKKDERRKYDDDDDGGDWAGAMSDHSNNRLAQEIRKNTQGYCVPKAIWVYDFYAQDTDIWIWSQKPTKWKSNTKPQSNNQENHTHSHTRTLISLKL